MRHVTAAALAVSMTGTPAMSWGVFVKFWNEKIKDTKFGRAISSKDCWRQEASFGLYDHDNKDCHY